MEKNSKKGKLFFYLINLLIIIIITIMTIDKIIDEQGVDVFKNIKNLSALSIVILTSLFFINYYLEGIVIAHAMNEYNKDFKPQYGFIIQCVGGLFSAITPLKIGYLPSIGYAYSRFNVKAEDVIKSMAKTTFSYQILCLIVSIISIIVCTCNEIKIEIGDTNLDLKYVAIIGLLYNIVLVMGYFILVLAPFLHEFILKIGAWFLFKFKKIDDKETYLSYQRKKAELMRNELKKFFKNIKEIMIIFILYTIKFLVFQGLPYIVYLLVTNNSFSINLWLYTIILNNLMSYITNLIPIPGASGAAELVFIAVFSLVYTPTSVLTSVMLVWRMFSYFINIIVGFIVFVILLNAKKKKEVTQ